MKNRPRFLCVEPVEDRLAPSSVPVSIDPPPMMGWGEVTLDNPLAHARGDMHEHLTGEDFGDRRTFFDSVELEVPDFTNRSEFIVTFSERVEPSRGYPTIVLSSRLPDLTEPIRLAVNSEPADGPRISNVRFSATATQTQATSTATAAAALAAPNNPAARLTPPTNGAPTNTFATGLNNQAASFIPGAARNPMENHSESPPGSSSVPGGGLTSPVPTTTPSDSPDTSVVTPDIDPMPNPRPAGHVIEQVVEAIFPDGIPFIGAVSVDPIPAGASALLTRIGTLAETATEGLSTPERWAWLSAVALTTVGVLASARPRRKQVLLATPRTASDLVRWEDRHDSGST